MGSYVKTKIKPSEITVGMRASYNHGIYRTPCTGIIARIAQDDNKQPIYVYIGCRWVKVAQLYRSEYTNKPNKTKPNKGARNG